MAHSDWLMRQYLNWRAHIPARWLYHADYFQVLGLLAAPPHQRQATADQRLRQVLADAIAYVPFYQRHVRISHAELANEPPAQLITRFPYLSKAEVMECQRDFLHARIDPRKLHYATSGGSSGQGIGLWRTKRLADIEKAFFTHEWARFGFTFDKARTLRIGADARAQAHEAPTRVIGNRLMLSPYHVNTLHRAAIVDAINRFTPAYVHAYPSSAAALAELIDAGDIKSPVRAVLLASEPATAQQLGAIERTFRCPVSVSYGLTERTNLAFANGAGPYRFEPLYGFSENLVTDGRHEIVGTSLWNDVMPLIRYRSNDFGRIEPDGSCAVIDGRAHEYLIDRLGNQIPGLSIVIDEVTWDFVRLYQIRQDTPGAITLAVVGRHGALSAEQKQFVLDAQLRRWGSFFDIGLEEVADIPLAANGKRQLVNNALRRGIGVP
jgi:phenylacetate-CoA ligase